MKSRILDLFAIVRASYWYIPLMLTITAVLLSLITMRIDSLLDPGWLQGIGLFDANNPEGARDFLTTIASSMITVAGVTFSMTIVAVSFAASQIGPRLTTNYMRDRSNQMTLGTFIGTYIYCLMVLRGVLNTTQGGMFIAFGGEPFVPQISLLVAVILTFCSILVLIYFIHHVPESINMSNVIAKVGEEMGRQASVVFPNTIGKECPASKVDIPSEFHNYYEVIKSKQHGYIRVLDGNALVSAAKNHDVILKLDVRPGHFLTENMALLHVYSKKKINKTLVKECVNAFAFGQQRNQEQDILFLVNEMVEIIARALSPGMNDPFTAMTVMDWLQLFLEKVSKNGSSSAYRYDKDNQLRLITKPILFSEFCEIIFCRIQPYVCQDRNTSLHMLHMISNIAHHIDDKAQQLMLVDHARALKIAVNECLPIQADRELIYSQFTQYFPDYNEVL